jgi:16S rRNA (guanine966-N2)-methyltransferase
MRIISGKHKGRKLQAPAKLPVRPTTDRAKEALFNWLEHRYALDELVWLDLFAGTGNMSFEAASRGCLQLTAVDKHPACCKYIRETAQHLEMPIQVIQADVFQWVEKGSLQADIIFADPPYDHPQLRQLPEMAQQFNLLNTNGILILEHPLHLKFEQAAGFIESRAYGQSVFSIFEFS